MEDDKRRTESIPPYIRKLPHWQPESAMFFITLRLANSLPSHIVQVLQATHEREQHIIHAKLSSNEIHRLDGQRYLLIAYCLMPDYIHLVIETTEHSFKPAHTGVTAKHSLTDTLKRLKGRTARFCNQALGRNGSFWQAESYDRVIRNQQEYEQIVWYTLNNPIKAGLIDGKTGHTPTLPLGMISSPRSAVSMPYPVGRNEFRPPA